MSNPIQVYQDNVGHTHEAAVQAVYNAGLADGQASNGVSAPTYPDLSPQLASAESTIATLTDELTAAQSTIGTLQTEVESLTKVK